MRLDTRCIGAQSATMVMTKLLQVHGQFWETWKQFEVDHGNEDTLHEMLRVKRSVSATYNTNVNYMSAQMLATIGGQAEVVGELSAADSMAQLEARAREEEKQAKERARPISFVRGESKTTQENTTDNPEEISVNMDDDDDDDVVGDESGENMTTSADPPVVSMEAAE